MSAEPKTQPGQRALRLVSAAQPPSTALKRLQRDLEAARAEANSLQELLEELPGILERKFRQRLQAIQSEQRQLETDNTLLQQHLFSLGSRVDPPGPPSPEALEDSAITQGLGLRRALRLRHCQSHGMAS